MQAVPQELGKGHALQVDSRRASMSSMSSSRQHCLYCCCLASEGGRQCSSAAAATATASVADETDYSSNIVLLSTETGHLQTNKSKVTRSFDWTPVPRQQNQTRASDTP
jgi:hypothetical protein